MILTRLRVKPSSDALTGLPTDWPHHAESRSEQSDIDSDGLDDLSESLALDTNNDIDKDESATQTIRYNKRLTYGERIGVKSDHTLRIGFQNFNGFSGKENDPVDQSFRKWVSEWDFDVFGIPEVNLFWPRVKPSLQFLDRVYSWFNPLQTRARCVYNKDEVRTKRSIRQYGGIAQIARGNAALRHNSTMDDPSGLGRWVSQQFLGKEERSLRVVTAYRPNWTTTAKIYSVYRQHWAAFRAKGLIREPREAFLTDLAQQLNEWRKAGEHLILLCDMNEDVRNPRIQQFLQEVGMKDLLLDQYGDKVAPRTHIRGSAPIDGIFATSAVDILRGGYCAFDEGVHGKRADH